MNISIKNQVWNKQTIAWYLYAFASSFMMMNAIVYFSQWVVLDNGFEDIWISLAIGLASVINILFGPYLGVVTDKKRNGHKFFLWFVGIAFLFAVLLQILGLSLSSQLMAVVLTLVLYALMNIFYRFAYQIYTAFVKNVTDPKHFGSVSGLSLAFGMIGSISGLVATLPIVNGTVEIFGVGRLSTIIPSAVVFILFSLPLIFASFGFNRKVEAQKEKVEGYRKVMKKIVGDLRNTKEHPGVLRVLVVFFFMAGSVLTLQLFSAVYLEQVIGASDSFKVVIYAIILGAFMVGAFAGGALGDKIGKKKVHFWSLVVATIFTIGIALGSSPFVYYFVFGFFGIFMGAAYASNRALFAELIPSEKSGEFFGIYILAERSASIFGPVTWGLVVFLVPAANAGNYRAAVFVMAILTVIASVFLMKVKEK